MPIYEYECGSCGQRFEELESFANRTKPHACPVCGGRKSKLVPSRVAGGSSCSSCTPSSGKSCGPT